MGQMGREKRKCHPRVEELIYIGDGISADRVHEGTPIKAYGMTGTVVEGGCLTFKVKWDFWPWVKSFLRGN